MSEKPDEPYDAERDAFESWHLAICELRKAYLLEAAARAVMRDTEEGREDVGCLRHGLIGGD